jgi:hypothetical protein
MSRAPVEHTHDLDAVLDRAMEDQVTAAVTLRTR